MLYENIFKYEVKFKNTEFKLIYFGGKNKVRSIVVTNFILCHRKICVEQNFNLVK